MVVQGSYAYAAFSHELAMLDIADPIHPVRVGYTLLPYHIYHLCVFGNYVIAAGSQSLSIINIANPSSPEIAGVFAFYGQPNGLAANGTHIFLSESPVYDTPGRFLYYRLHQPLEADTGGLV